MYITTVNGKTWHIIIKYGTVRYRLHEAITTIRTAEAGFTKRHVLRRKLPPVATMYHKMHALFVTLRRLLRGDHAAQLDASGARTRSLVRYADTAIRNSGLDQLQQGYRADYHVIVAVCVCERVRLPTIIKWIDREMNCADTTRTGWLHMHELRCALQLCHEVLCSTDFILPVKLSELRDVLHNEWVEAFLNNGGFD